MILIHPRTDGFHLKTHYVPLIRQRRREDYQINYKKGLAIKTHVQHNLQGKASYIWLLSTRGGE